MILWKMWLRWSGGRKLKKQTKGIGFYLMIIFVAIALYMTAKMSLSSGNSYTYQDFKEDIEEDNIKEIVIAQKKEIPTEYIAVTSSADVKKTM